MRVVVMVVVMFVSLQVVAQRGAGAYVVASQWLSIFLVCACARERTDLEGFACKL